MFRNHQRSPCNKFFATLRELKVETGSEEHQQLAIVVNLNWLTCNKTKESDCIKSMSERAADIIEFYSKRGLVVMIISDPESHHHSKIASTQRRSVKAKQNTEIRVARFKLN